VKFLIFISIGSIYLFLLIAGITFILTNYNISDFFSYEFIRLNKNIILDYRRENFLALTSLFFIFSIVWVLLLGFVMPLLIFSGFVFGKWWGILIVLTSTTMGATMLYFLIGLFFRDIIQEKLAPKFIKLKKFFNKNELVYFMFYRFIGGGGTPYAIQGSGIEAIIDQNEKLSTVNVIFSPDIYIPIVCFFILLIIGSVIKKIYFKE